MAYKYITDNNLYEKQNYMYSEYRGMAFIKEYLDSRRYYLKSLEMNVTESFHGIRKVDNKIQQELLEICRKLEKGNYDKETKALLDAYIKSFEVRKRIYTSYDRNWRPLPDAGFEDYKSYVLLADCLLRMYQSTGSLKYFSCLLKLDDTLLSIKDRLESGLKGYLGHIIRQELNIFYQLADEHEIGEEIQEWY